MILLSHPTGNANVRAVLQALETADQLAGFQTTIAVPVLNRYIKLLPSSLRQELLRRTYDIPVDKITSHPFKEIVRLISSKLNADVVTKHEGGWASVDAVYRDLDRHVSQQLQPQSEKYSLSGVYCYEDAALSTFNIAKQLGLKCFYDLPIAYWQTSQQLLHEEAARLPAWEPTLVGNRDSVAKLERKTQELNLADVVICPSKFVYDSLPVIAHQTKTCIISEFGSPEIKMRSRPSRPKNSPLRLLFVGSMTQRKGLADLFTAMKLLRQSDVELIVMGSPIAPMEFYRSQFPNFIYEPTRPHPAVLELMRSCDVLVLPSIVEGRALVQQEAMSCGLPLIITPNTGGEDLIDQGKTGLLVPIRSPEKLAEAINWFVDHRYNLAEISQLTQQKAAQVTWEKYQQKILKTIQSECIKE